MRLKAGINTTRFNWEYVFGPETRSALAELLDFDAAGLPEEPDPRAVARNVEGAEVILSTWGAVPYTAEVLERAPKLRLILYAAGAFKQYVTPELLARPVTVCTAVHLNAIPTAEFTLGIILASLKNAFTYHLDFLQRGRAAWDKDRVGFNGGYYKTKVGLLGYGLITRHLLKLLRNFEMEVYVETDHASEEELAQQGARKATLEWIMANCDVISIHKSDVPKNWNTINRENLKLMKKGARLINTARGRIVNEEDLAAKLAEGDITAYLDVTYPEPPPDGHPFYRLPNCVLTPHVAGSIGGEVRRMGDYCLRELENWLAGRPLENRIDLAQLEDRA